MNRVVWILLGSTFVTGLIVVVILATVQKPLEHSEHNKQRFDRSIWMSYHGSMDRDNLRGAMANDLRTRLLREHPTHKQVLNMLGEPDVEQSDDKFSYRLGMWSNNRQTRDVMEIYFTEGRVNDIQFIPE